MGQSPRYMMEDSWRLLLRLPNMPIELHLAVAVMQANVCQPEACCDMSAFDLLKTSWAGQDGPLFS